MIPWQRVEVSMPYKYSKTWKAIDEAIQQSHGLQRYTTISNLVSYMRQYPADTELLDWNLVVCAGHEMEDDEQAPIWNGVIGIFNSERHGEGMKKWNKVNKVAREHQSDKEAV
jgi:hypothetical protein